jgi:hypothetical protein
MELSPLVDMRQKERLLEGGIIYMVEKKRRGIDNEY